jgi:hypothetical protein
MAYDVTGALAAGGTEEGIANFLAKKHNYDLAGALRAGGTHRGVIDHLVKMESAGQPAPQAAPPSGGAWDAFTAGAKVPLLGMMNMVGDNEELLKEAVKKRNEVQEEHPIATPVGSFAGAALPLIAGSALTRNPTMGALGMLRGGAAIAPGLRQYLGMLPATTAVAGGFREEDIIQHQLRGGSKEASTLSANIKFPLNAAFMAAPAALGFSKLAGAVTGAGINVLGGAGIRGAGNIPLPESAQEPIFDPALSSIEGGLGAVVGMIGRGGRAGRRATDPEAKPAAEGPATGAVTQEQSARTQKAHLERKLAAMESQKEKYSADLHSAQSPQAQESLKGLLSRLDENIANTNGQIATLRTFLGEDAAARTVDQGIPDVAPPNARPIDAGPGLSIGERTANGVREAMDLAEADAKREAANLETARISTEEASVEQSVPRGDPIPRGTKYDKGDPDFSPVGDKNTVHYAFEVGHKDIQSWAADRVLRDAVAKSEKLREWESRVDNAIQEKKPYSGIQATVELIMRELMDLRAEVLRRLTDSTPKAFLDGKLVKADGILYSLETARARGDAEGIAFYTNLKKQMEDFIGPADVQRMAAIKAAETSLPPMHDPRLEPLLREQNLDAALDMIIDTYKNRSISIIAKWIRDNPRIRPFMDMFNLTGKDNLGEFHGDLGPRGTIRISEAARSSPVTLIHELLHGVSKRMLSVVMAVREQSLGPIIPNRALRAEYDAMPKAAQDAAKDVLNLRAHLLREHPELLDKFPRAMEDPHEFFTYGLSDEGFKMALMQVSGTGYFKNPIKQLFNDFARMLGFGKDKKVRSAMEELFVAGETMAKYSTGKGLDADDRMRLGIPTKDELVKNQKSLAETLRHLPLSANRQITLNEILSVPDIKRKISYWFSKNWFGPQQFALQIKDNPLLFSVAKAVHDAEDLAERYSNFVMYGKQHISTRPKVGPFISIDKIESGGSLPHILNNTKPGDWEVLAKLMHFAMDNGIPHDRILAEHSMHLTAHQKTVYEGLVDLMERDRTFLNGHVLQDAPWAQVSKKKGWFPAVRKGDYEVVALYGDLALLSERVRTIVEAEHLQTKLEGDPNWNRTKIKIIDKQAERANEPQRAALVKELHDQIIGTVHGTDLPESVQMKLIDAMVERLGNRGPVAGHHMFRKDVPGYEGRKVYQTDAEMGKEFRQSWIDYISERSTNIKKGSIQHGTIQHLTSPLIQERMPNAVALGQHMVDMAVGDFNTIFHGTFDKGVRNFVDRVVVGAAHMVPAWKDWYPKSHIIDRTHGVAAHLFYMATLTTRPGFWLAQVMSSTQGLRLMFRTDNTAQAFVGVGKGMMTIMSGGDADWHRAVHYGATEKNVFHPALTSELTGFKWDFKDHYGTELAAKFLRNILPWAAGEKMSAGADAYSRYVNFAWFYHKHKDAGLRGKALYDAAAEDTMSTMVVYDNPHKAPVIRKLGLVGDAISPLQTFATAQFGNLVADLKYMHRQGYTPQSTLPFLATGMTTMLMGGAFGLPFIIEYEALRQMLIAIDEDTFSSMPSVIDMLSREEAMEIKGLPKGALAYGLPSASLGIDVGSGLRWNAIISKALLEDQSLLTMFPAVEYGRQLGLNAVLAFSSELPDDMVRQAQKRKAAMFIGSHITGLKALTDEVLFDAGGRDFVPGGARNYAMRPQTDQERWSTLVGNRTIRAAQDSAIEQTLRKEDMQEREKAQKYIDLFLDGVKLGDTDRVQRAVDKMIEAEMDPNSINSQLEAAYAKRDIDQRMRYYVNSKGRVTSDSAQKRYLRQRKYGE